MILIGLAGQAGVGKDTVADYLVARYGFVKFAFSDALYREVTEAFVLPDESLLRDRARKELPTYALAGENCNDQDFTAVMARFVGAGDLACSPRQILQWWGTEYRRAQDPEYWVSAASRWLHDYRRMFKYPEQRPQFFVNTTVRFPNEREFIHEHADGNVWHIRRGSAAPVAAHVSEAPLSVLEGERELYNNDTIGRLHLGIEMLLRTQARFVKVEPMLPAGPHVGVGEQGVE